MWRDGPFQSSLPTIVAPLFYFVLLAFTILSSRDVYELINFLDKD